MQLWGEIYQLLNTGNHLFFTLCRQNKTGLQATASVGLHDEPLHSQAEPKLKKSLWLLGHDGTNQWFLQPGPAQNWSRRHRGERMGWAKGVQDIQTWQNPPEEAGLQRIWLQSSLFFFVSQIFAWSYTRRFLATPRQWEDCTTSGHTK